MNNEALTKKLFELYMDNNHPYILPVIGLLRLILGLLIVASVISLFWYDGWWKLSIVSGVIYYAYLKGVEILMGYYVGEFQSR